MPGPVVIVGVKGRGSRECIRSENSYQGKASALRSRVCDCFLPSWSGAVYCEEAPTPPSKVRPPPPRSDRVKALLSNEGLLLAFPRTRTATCLQIAICRCVRRFRCGVDFLWPNGRRTLESPKEGSARGGGTSETSARFGACFSLSCSSCAPRA
jgi:hypothetical protein